MNDPPVLFVIAVIPLLVGVLLAAVEVARRDDLGWPRRILWWLGLLFVPPIALALYAITRPPRHRAAIAVDVPATERATAVVDLVQQHVHGDVSDEEYRTMLDAIRK